MCIIYILYNICNYTNRVEHEFFIKSTNARIDAFNDKKKTNFTYSFISNIGIKIESGRRTCRCNKTNAAAHRAVISPFDLAAC